MKTKIAKLLICTLLTAATLINTSCMTTYDRYGRPVQSVDPIVAVGAAAATGLIAYSAGKNQNYNNYGYRASCNPPSNWNGYGGSTNYGYGNYGNNTGYGYGVNHTYANQRESMEYRQKEGYRRMVQSDDYRRSQQSQNWGW